MKREKQKKKKFPIDESLIIHKMYVGIIIARIIICVIEKKKSFIHTIARDKQ